MSNVGLVLGSCLARRKRGGDGEGGGVQKKSVRESETEIKFKIRIVY